MVDLRCGLMWAGDSWVLLTVTTYGELRAMNPSPPISDVQLHALRASAHHSQARFRSAIEDDALRMWFAELSEEQVERMQHVLGRVP